MQGPNSRWGQNGLLFTPRPTYLRGNFLSLSKPSMVSGFGWGKNGAQVFFNAFPIRTANVPSPHGHGGAKSVVVLKKNWLEKYFLGFHGLFFCSSPYI